MGATAARGEDGRYAAFISYAHRDGAHACWLHRALETYRTPVGVAVDGKRLRLGRVFLDRSELATSVSLSDRIEEALARSDNLVVICSPAARASRWVNEEIRRFRLSGRGDRIFCLIVDGDPARQDEGGCFPPALLEVAPGQARPEPLAADIRPGNDKPDDARLKLLAGLLDLPFDALRRREAVRRQRFLTIVAGVSLALLTIMSVLTVLALIARSEAETQRAKAVKQYETAERTSGFLLDVFNQANPEHAESDSAKTLKDAVDDAAARLLAMPGVTSDADMRASLLAVMADAYNNMGRAQDSRRLLDVALASPIGDPEIRVRVLLADAALRLLESDYANMRKDVDAGLAIVAGRPDLGAYRAKLIFYRAQLEQADGNRAAAMRDWHELRSLGQAARDRDTVLRALLGEGSLAVDGDDPDRGAPLLRRLIAERTAMGQPNHPQVLAATNTLGAVEIKRGQPAVAEGWFRRAERLQRQVFGDAGMEVAVSRSNLGRALVEQGRFAEAAATLEAARTGLVAQGGKRVDALANLDDSRGLALGGLGKVAAARIAFADGLSVAREHQMPKEIELLTDRAELECGARAVDQGLALVADARAALARFGLTEPWRRARIDAVAGGCLLAAGRAAAARPLLAGAVGPVVARWGADNLFGRRVREDARRAGVEPSRR